MKGPMPKDPALLQRRNRVATRAVLAAVPQRRRRPRLPTRSGGQDWHTLTRTWWAAVWHSPMAAEFLDADVKGRLYRLAALVDMFWTHPSAYLDAQICRNEAALGLSPMDRRRLQWTVEKAEQETRKRTMPAPPTPADDPRAILRVV